MIADHMNRQSLKQYISLLKQEEKKKQLLLHHQNPYTMRIEKNYKVTFLTNKLFIF